MQLVQTHKDLGYEANEYIPLLFHSCTDCSQVIVCRLNPTAYIYTHMVIVKVSPVFLLWSLAPLQEISKYRLYDETEVYTGIYITVETCV